MKVLVLKRQNGCFLRKSWFHLVGHQIWSGGPAQPSPTQLQAEFYQGFCSSLAWTFFFWEMGPSNRPQNRLAFSLAQPTILGQFLRQRPSFFNPDQVISELYSTLRSQFSLLYLPATQFSYTLYLCTWIDHGRFNISECMFSIHTGSNASTSWGWADDRNRVCTMLTCWG